MTTRIQCITTTVMDFKKDHLVFINNDRGIDFH